MQSWWQDTSGETCKHEQRTQTGKRDQNMHRQCTLWTRYLYSLSESLVGLDDLWFERSTHSRRNIHLDVIFEVSAITALIPQSLSGSERRHWYIRSHHIKSSGNAGFKTMPTKNVANRIARANRPCRFVQIPRLWISGSYCNWETFREHVNLQNKTQALIRPNKRCVRGSRKVRS